MHCKDCKFWDFFSDIYIEEKKVLEDGYCPIQKRVMLASDLCKYIDKKIYKKQCP